MLFRNNFTLSVISCSIFFQLTVVHGLIDPFTGTLAAGALVTGYLLSHSNYAFPYFGYNCPKTIDIQKLQLDMENNFFGQHIASKIILSALKGNYGRSSNNKKPLVMSFHGCTGCGKNFITDVIATHMFGSEKVKKIRYHVINGRSDFMLQSKTIQYKEELHKKIRSAIKNCDTNLFVFDEIHYIPPGILDVLIPILENHDTSVDSRNSIFIFLTNSGSPTIVKKYLDLWTRGYSREQMRVQDFDSILQKSAFNEIGGLMKSQMIDSHIIDHYVPFLPLEKKHVEQCIEAELRHLNKNLNSEAKKAILEIISFSPEPHKLFATTGCKRIKNIVTAESSSDYS